MEDLLLYDENILRGIKDITSIDVTTRFVVLPVFYEKKPLEIQRLEYDRTKRTVYINGEDITYLKDYLNDPTRSI